MPESAKPAGNRTGMTVLSIARIESTIHLIRGQKVMLDSDLATLYGVSTKRLNEQVRRNIERFPSDFMFELNPEEAELLRSQFATLKPRRGKHRKYLPHAFTEHGAVMLASVLNSPRAVEASIYVVRAFVRMRELVATHKELAAKIAELERKVGKHDESIQSIITAMRQLIAPPPTAKRRIGFRESGKT